MPLCCCEIITAATVFLLMLNATANAGIQTAAAECVNKSSLCSCTQTHTHTNSLCERVSKCVYYRNSTLLHLQSLILPRGDSCPSQVPASIFYLSSIVSSMSVFPDTQP